MASSREVMAEERAARSVHKAAEIAAMLRDIRKRKGISQEEVAEAIGYSKSNVSRIESGKRGLPLDQLETWAHVLDVRVEILVWDERHGVDPGFHISEGELESDDALLLRQVAATLPHMSQQARDTMTHLLSMWRDADRD